jgi:hypothetical protein
MLLLKYSLQKTSDRQNWLMCRASGQMRNSLHWTRVPDVVSVCLKMFVFIQVKNVAQIQINM